MNNKIYLIILIVLVVIFAITKINNKVEKRISFFKVDSLKLAKFDIISKEDTITINRINDEWKLSYPVEYAVNENQLNSFFTKVLKVETSNLPISEQESSLEGYNLTDSLATHLILYDTNGKILDSSLIGKSDNYDNSPARKFGKNQIFRLETNISHLLNADINRWRDKSIVKIEEKEIDNIIISYQNNDYKISFKDSTWFYEDNKSSFAVKNDNSNLRMIFSSLSKILAKKFLDNEFENYKEEFATPFVTIDVTKNNAELISLEVILNDEEYIIQKNNETQTLYIINKNFVDHFMKIAEDFR